MPESSLTARIDLYDTELLAVEKVVEALQEKSGKNVDLEGFRKEFIGRFVEIGLVVDVLVYTTDQPGLFWFEGVITERTEPKPFDYDRQVHEVTHDVLGLGESGFIKTDFRVIEGGKR